jgi:hypothetical protein
MKQIKPMLKPPGTKLPSAHKASTAPQPVRRSARQRDAAAVFASGSAAPLLGGMPGSWPEADLRAASEAVDTYLKRCPPSLPYTPLIVTPFFEAVELASCLSVLNPFGELPE